MRKVQYNSVYVCCPSPPVINTDDGQNLQSGCQFRKRPSRTCCSQKWIYLLRVQRGSGGEGKCSRAGCDCSNSLSLSAHINVLLSLANIPATKYVTWRWGNAICRPSPLFGGPGRLKWPLIESSSTLAEGPRCRSLCSLPLGNMKWGNITNPSIKSLCLTVQSMTIKLSLSGWRGESPVYKKKTRPG